MKARRIPFPSIADERGDLGYLDFDRHVPFTVCRLFFIRDIPGDARRGGHAHSKHDELILVLSGALSFRLYDGQRRQTLTLTPAGDALLLPKMTWLDFTGVAPSSSCLVLASGNYDERDYIRDPVDFHERLGL